MRHENVFDASEEKNFFDEDFLCLNHLQLNRSKTNTNIVNKHVLTMNNSNEPRSSFEKCRVKRSLPFVNNNLRDKLKVVRLELHR